MNGKLVQNDYRSSVVAIQFRSARGLIGVALRGRVAQGPRVMHGRVPLGQVAGAGAARVRPAWGRAERLGNRGRRG